MSNVDFSSLCELLTATVCPVEDYLDPDGPEMSAERLFASEYRVCLPERGVDSLGWKNRTTQDGTGGFPVEQGDIEALEYAESLCSGNPTVDRSLTDALRRTIDHLRSAETVVLTGPVTERETLPDSDPGLMCLSNRIGWFHERLSVAHRLADKGPDYSDWLRQQAEDLGSTYHWFKCQPGLRATGIRC
jgi:hypothetical protein